MNRAFALSSNGIDINIRHYLEVYQNPLFHQVLGKWVMKDAIIYSHVAEVLFLASWIQNLVVKIPCRSGRDTIEHMYTILGRIGLSLKGKSNGNLS